ncbi:hypothetical protein GGI24_006639 [Coemansia furcata]|nr:hypothetical protein GGI24_006639 [Coemansia furcata]
MPSHPGMYGALPMPYPLPHPMAMHCGYLPPPPLMYGVPPSMGSPALPPPGLGPTTPHSHASAPPSAVSEAMAAQSEMWLAEHGIDANGVPQSKMVLAMPGTDHYNHAVVAAAAAAAAGYPMNVPFMYPHIDAPMSAAATGGSENNESVVSVDSATNRGMANRYASTTHYAQQHQQAGGDSSRGGFMSPGEYPPATTNAPYAWSEHAKQGAYPYAQQQQQQQQQQAYYQGAAQGGYRRRGSGSNNSSGSGSANGNSNNGGGNYQQQPRDHRRGNNNNAGYQRQQRWNNNNSNSGGYNSRHRHSNYGQDAQAPGFGSGSGGVAPSDVSMGSSGGGSSGYYNVQQPQ